MNPTRPPAVRPALAVILLGLALLSPSTLRADEPGPRRADAPASLLDQPLSEYKARREALMERVSRADAVAAVGALIGGRRRGGGEGEEADPSAAPSLIVVVGETDEPEDDRYRQTNPFAYLTGVEDPRAALILRPADGTSVLYVPPRDKVEEAWTGPRIGPGPAGVAATGIDRVEPTSRLLVDLFAAIGETGRRPLGRPPTSVYILGPDPGPDAGGPSAGLARLLKGGAPHARIGDLGPILAELRKVKSEPEIRLLRRAIAITGKAQAEAARLLAPGVPEYRVEGAILGTFVGEGGTRAGFPSIVGSGPNSTVLHYNANRRAMADGDLVVVDIGAEYAYYTADITRTYPVAGKFTPRQREVYQLVLDCQSAAASACKVGESTLRSQDAFAHEFIRKSPLRARDGRGVERTMDHFFIHGLGHYLGMDVHDVGDTSRPIAPGEVFTIEPGIYLPAEGFGVRIEDDYLATKDGVEKLSKDIPSEPDEVERTVERARAGRVAGRDGADPATSRDRAAGPAAK